MSNRISRNERTIKTVLISRPSIRGYSRWEYRVVECQVGQRGYANERGVKILWRSQNLYRPTTKSGRGQGPEALEMAERIAQEKLAEALGLN